MSLLFGALVWASAMSMAGAQATDQNVEVDLQPCILAKDTIEQDKAGVSEADLFSELFKGFWSARQYNLIAPGEDTLDLTIDDFHGRCNVIFVGINCSQAQYAQLTAYSQRFQVRIVYFDESQTADDEGIMDRLGLGQYFDIPLVDIPVIKLTDAATPRVINPSLETDPLTNNIFTRPVRQLGPALNGTTTIVADYADVDGNSLEVEENGITYPSVAAVTYLGDGGEEEMHVYFSMAWFDLGSWGWGHYIMEWGTKGIFAGERRFWLGAMVDDLFLETNVFEYNPDGGNGATIFDGIQDFNEGPAERLTGAQLSTSVSAEASFNSRFNAEIVTEYPFNGLGILEKVDSAYVLSFDDADAALLPKGDPPQVNDDGTLGLPPILPTNWWVQATVDGMRAEYESGAWATDDLLSQAVDLKNLLYWQSHTLSHLARDNLGQSDCNTEDGGNAQIAVITGLFDADTYDWRSMTNPGITGLFNKNCLASAVNNLMTCAPGDNTFDGVQTNVTLVNLENQFHSLITDEATNGYAGFRIAPRFATFVYFNCVTTDCLLLENLYIRRTVCGCTDVDPGTIDSLNTNTLDCDMNLCPSGLENFNTVDELFDTEANATARYIMNGRRDKYMFHQANVIPTSTPAGTLSLLEYWYEVVLTKMASYLNLQGTDPFPLKSVKFDDLCTNFGEHEELDNSGALVTVTKAPDGGITGMSLEASAAASVIPITVPTSFASSVSTSGLPPGQPYDTQTYGSDTTFYVATSENDQPRVVVKPTAEDLAPIPASAPDSTPSPVAAATQSPVVVITPTAAPVTPVDPGSSDSNDDSKDSKDSKSSSSDSKSSSSDSKSSSSDSKASSSDSKSSSSDSKDSSSDSKDKKKGKKSKKSKR